MVQLVDFLYQQSFKDSRLAFRLTLLELPNLLALLDRLAQGLATDPTSAETVSDTAGRIEQLLANLGRPQALARAAAVREAAAAAIPDWSIARFEHERLQIERLLGQGKGQAAYTQAQALLERATAAGPTAYAGADYDLAMATNLLGRVYFAAGQADPALNFFEKSRKLFEALNERGKRMAAGVLFRQANCLEELGRLDEAAGAYEDAIEWFEKLGDYRSVAAGKGQLANIRRKQGKYAEAVAGYEAARAIFAAQNELASVATIWHQLGMVHQDAGAYDVAEAACRRSLEIKTQLNNQQGQASTLTQLGNLYDDNLNRPEEAVTFYRQAAAIYVAAGDLRSEGVTRNNIADTLRKLERHDEARAEIRRAIECKQQIGHAAEPWKSYDILQRIESATGNAAAARVAWGQARDAYLAYRRQGGYAQGGGGKLVDDVLGLIAQEKAEEIGPLFAQLVNDPNATDSLKQLMQAVVAILNGSREQALADDPALVYADAAEVLWLIERLS